MDTKLYCAGTFPFDFRDPDYMKNARKDYRSILLSKLGGNYTFLEKKPYIPLSGNVRYNGPFYFESDGMVDSEIVETEMQMISDCTHIIFLLDDGCCPGTITELIFAATLKKNVEIFYIKKADDEETESTLHSPCWFPIIACQLINPNTNITACIDYSDATKKIINYVKNLVKGEIASW